MKSKKSISHQKSGFQVPENYFAELEDRLLDAISAEKAASLPKMSSGFEVPEGYFERLEVRILNKLDTTSKVIPFYSNPKWYYAAAVAAVFIAVASSLLLQPTAQQSIDSVEVAAIEQYLEGENTDVNSDDITSFIYDEGYVIDNISNIGINDEAVVDYLNENVEDPSLIFE